MHFSKTSRLLLFSRSLLFFSVSLPSRLFPPRFNTVELAKYCDLAADLCFFACFASQFSSSPPTFEKQHQSAERQLAPELSDTRPSAL